MSDRENLYAYTEPSSEGNFYVGYLSLNREENGDVTLTVRSADDTGSKQGTIVLPRMVMVSLAGALKYDGAGMAGAGG